MVSSPHARTRQEVFICEAMWRKFILDKINIGSKLTIDFIHRFVSLNTLGFTYGIKPTWKSKLNSELTSASQFYTSVLHTKLCTKLHIDNAAGRFIKILLERKMSKEIMAFFPEVKSLQQHLYSFVWRAKVFLKWSLAQHWSQPMHSAVLSVDLCYNMVWTI